MTRFLKALVIVAASVAVALTVGFVAAPFALVVTAGAVKW